MKIVMREISPPWRKWLLD